MKQVLEILESQSGSKKNDAAWGLREIQMTGRELRMAKGQASSSWSHTLEGPHIPTTRTCIDTRRHMYQRAHRLLWLSAPSTRHWPNMTGTLHSAFMINPVQSPSKYLLFHTFLLYKL